MKTHLIEYNNKLTQPLYHKSSNLFSFPSWTEIDKFKDGCEKRVLGLWTTGNPHLNGFGDYCYEITMSPNSRYKALALSHLIKIHYGFSEDKNPIEEYKKLRNIWQSEADIVFILDNNPHIGEVIIINFEKILDFKLINS